MSDWTVYKIYKWLKLYLKNIGIESYSTDTEYILSKILNVDRGELFLLFDRVLKEDEKKLLSSYVKRRVNFEPIQYIFNEAYFYGYKFKVDENVLIPRVETEFLVELVINFNPKKILEIGTGSGAISIALAHNLKNVEILATDISTKALEIAKLNAFENKVNNINFIQSDLFEKIEDKFDVIVSNPPYISKKEYELLEKQVRNFEPEIALLAEDDGILFYKEILKNAKKYLNTCGKIVFEIGYNQRNILKPFLNSYKKYTFMKDLNNFNRYLIIE